MKKIEAFETRDGKFFIDRGNAAKHEGCLVMEKKLYESQLFFNGRLEGVTSAETLKAFLFEMEGWVKAMMGWTDVVEITAQEVEDKLDAQWVYWEGGAQPLQDDIFVDYIQRGDSPEVIDCDKARDLRWDNMSSDQRIKKYRISLKQPDKYIGWNGGDCPVHPNNAVAIQTRTGGPIKTALAGNCDWTHDQDSSDIITYKVVES